MSDLLLDLFNNTANFTYNGTFWWKNLSHNFDDHNSEPSPYTYIRSVLMSLGIIATVLTIISNVTLVLLILTNGKFRCRPFYWHILTLCSSDLLMGIFVIPFGVSYIHKAYWKHGVEFCKIWSVLEITHFSFSATILIALCCDRLEAKLSTLSPVSIYRSKFLPVALCLFPWIFVLFICLPILIIGERSLNIPPFMDRAICVFVLQEEFYLPSFSVTYILPIIVLGIVSVTMLIVYNVKSAEWYRLNNSDRGDTERQILQTSTIATLVVSILTLLFWFPYLTVMFMIVTCHGGTCMPNVWAYTVTYTLSMITSQITPLLWLIHTEIRQAFKNAVASLVYRFSLCRNWSPSTGGFDMNHAELLEDNAEL